VLPLGLALKSPATSLGLFLCAALSCVGCSSGLRVSVHATPESAGTVRFELSARGGRSDCQVFESGARATVDGVQLALKSQGRPRAPLRVSGASIEQGGCDPAMFEIVALPVSSGEAVSVVTVADGKRRVRMEIANLRAPYVVTAIPSMAAPGQRVSLFVSAPGDPPLRHQEDLEVSLYQGGRRAAVVSRPQLEVRERQVSFTLPALAAGTIEMALQYRGDELAVSGCQGARRCEAVRVGAPREVAFTVLPAGPAGMSAGGGPSRRPWAGEWRSPARCRQTPRRCTGRWPS
jgi:hypothetical protein